MIRLGTLGAVFLSLGSVCFAATVEDSSPLSEKARFLERDLVDKHSLDGLYISIVPSAARGAELPHTVNEPGNVIHAGVWTGRYLAGVGYQYAVTKDPSVRRHGGQILTALRVLQEVTGKPGLLARGYVKGHGPVEDWERDGRDSVEWHQGRGDYADYRWYGDVSVDNFNAVLYGYGIYYDLAADDQQKEYITNDVERLMAHLLDNHCRIIDVDGEVTRYGHVGIDPDAGREAYYNELYARRMRFYGVDSVAEMPLRGSLMLLPDLLIAHRITGNERYQDFYRRIVARFKNNADRPRRREDDENERLARANHSSEGQAYEAMYNLVRYETDPELLAVYRRWVLDLWERNFSEGNSLFTYMTLALLPEYRPVTEPGSPRTASSDVPHGEEGLRLANETLRLFPVDRVLRPVMNSLRDDIELNPNASRLNRKLSLRPVPIDQRPHDNEYEWKGNPYRLDGWLKPTVTAMQFSCDDPQVAWFCDSRGRIMMTLDGGQTWVDMTGGLMGARVTNIAASTTRTFVLWAMTGRGVFITRDGGMSWREAPTDSAPEFVAADFHAPQRHSDEVSFRIDDSNRLVRTPDGGKSSQTSMEGWRIPLAHSVFSTPWGVVASGPGGAYLSPDGQRWRELKLWGDSETGAADYLHAYWMGRYYGFVAAD